MDNYYISVVTPARGNEELCLNAIRSLRQHAASDFQMVFIDNGSDHSAPLAPIITQEMRGRDILIRNESGRSFAAANNQGVAVATGAFILLLNNDIEATGDWQTPLMVGARENDIIGPTARELGKTVDESGNYMGILQCVRENNTMKVGDISKPNSYLEGWCLFMRKEYYQTIGGLDETFWPFYGEDSDLCLRARSLGGRLATVEVPITHLFHKDTEKYISRDFRAVSARLNEYKLYSRWIEGKII